MKRFFMLRIAGIAVALALTSCQGPPPAPLFDLKSRPVTVQGTSLTHYYHWAEPPTPTGSSGLVPLVVYLHGWGPSNLPRDLTPGYPAAPGPLVDLASSGPPAYVYVPVCPPPYRTMNEPTAPNGGEWNSPAAKTMVVDTLEFLKAHYPIDPSRIYLVGFSMGGAGCWFIGDEYHKATGSQFAAVVRGSGWYLDQMPNRQDLNDSLRLGPTWIHVGDAEGRGYEVGLDTVRDLQQRFAAGPAVVSVRSVTAGLSDNPSQDTLNGTLTPLTETLTIIPLAGSEVRFSVYHGRAHEDLMFRNTDLISWLFDQHLSIPGGPHGTP